MIVVLWILALLCGIFPSAAQAALMEPTVSLVARPLTPRSLTPRSLTPQPLTSRSLMPQLLAPQLLTSQLLTQAARPFATRPISGDPASMCEAAVTSAEYVNHLPARLLDAISLTETGRMDPVVHRLRPWPWAINAEGESLFFATKGQVIAAVQALLAKGVKSIDVGCLQVNLMYHPDAFASLAAAFDPASNANYAARFLNVLYASGKNWPHAIAAYHSETPALGEAYRILVEARWQRGGTSTASRAGAYRDFADYKTEARQAYGAFGPRSTAYGAFSPR